MKTRFKALVAAIALALPAVAAQAQPEAPAAAAVATVATLAVVNGQVVTMQEFDRAYTVVARQKFYHRTPPEGQAEAARAEVAESLVDRALVLQEAAKRRLGVDEAAVDLTIEGYEKQYAASPAWKSMREKVLPQLRRELADQQRLAKIESEVRNVPAPDDAAVRAFYRANPQLFTEPERVHLSVILLKVDPSAGKAVRDQAREEGRSIRERIARGADFAELAKLHSGDGSAAKGGDLGYLHKGMLGDGIHEEIDKLKPGDLSASFDVLDGVAIFKLHERHASALRDFDSVKSRAFELAKRQSSENAWKQFVAELRVGAKIEKVAPVFGAPAAPDGAREKDPSWAAADKSRGP